MDALTKPIRFLVFIILLGVFLYFGKSVLIPFCLAGLLAMLFLPFVRYLESKNWNRIISAVVPVVVLVIAGAGILFLLFWQLQDFAKNASQIEQRITGFVDKARSNIESTFGISAKEQQEMIKKSSQQGTGKVSGAITGVLGSFFSIAVNTVLVMVYIFLFIYFRDHIKNFILKIVKPEDRDDTRSAISQSAKVSVKYLSGLAMMIGLLWVLYSIGFSIVGVKYAIFFAILCGLLEIVPFVGNLTGTALTIIVTLAQGGDGNTVLGIVLVYGVVQFVQSYILEPLVVGAEVNVNPLMTIFSIVVGEAVWGIGGMILAIPLVGIVKIICDHVPSLKPYGYLIGNKKGQSKEGGWLEKIKKKFSSS